MDAIGELLRILNSPPLPQVILSSTIIVGVSYVLMRVLRLNNPRIRSAFFSLALITPLAFYIFFTPSIWFTRYLVTHGLPPYAGAASFEVGQVVEVNYAGVVCVVGAIVGAATLALSAFFSVAIVKRFQGVVEVTHEEEPRIFDMVESVATRMGVPTPRVGLTEHLQPNAFTVGRGEGAMVVFTMGLIDTLDQRELEAVTAHEIAHIKNGDFSLMAMLTSLKVALFYNPISYLALSMVSREREYLADEVSSRTLSTSKHLRRALRKIAEAKPVREGNPITNLATGLFVYSQIGSLKSAFTAHPKLETRLRRVGVRSSARWDAAKTVVVAGILVGTLFLGSGYILQPVRVLGHMLYDFGPAHGMGVMTFGGAHLRETALGFAVPPSTRSFMVLSPLSTP